MVFFVAYLPLSTGQGNVDESAGVLEALESTALGDLRLLLGLNLFVKILVSNCVVGGNHRGGCAHLEMVSVASVGVRTLGV